MHSHVSVIASTDGQIVFWSEGAEAAFGFPASRAIGETLDLIVPPAFRADHWRGFRRAMQSGEAAAEGQASPFPVQLASGEVGERPGRLTLVRAPDGAVVGAVVVFG